MSNIYSNSNFWEKYSSYLINKKYNGGKIFHSLTSLERLYASYIKGNTLHPFCNFGMNTFCLEKYSDKITGLDFSKPAIEFANEYKTKINSNCNFIHSNFFDFETDTRYDTIFISYGVLDWVDNLDLFLQKINSLLSVNGKFIVLEYHSDFYKELVKGDNFKKLSNNSFEVSEKIDDYDIPAKKSILGNGRIFKNDNIFGKITIHETDEMISKVKESGFKVDILQFYNYLEFKQSPSDIKIGNSKYFKGEYDLNKNMLFGGVFSKI